MADHYGLSESDKKALLITGAKAARCQIADRKICDIFISPAPCVSLLYVDDRYNSMIYFYTIVYVFVDCNKTTESAYMKRCTAVQPKICR